MTYTHYTYDIHLSAKLNEELNDLAGARAWVSRKGGLLSSRYVSHITHHNNSHNYTPYTPYND
jgi:hypothetical protein